MSAPQDLKDQIAAAFRAVDSALPPLLLAQTAALSATLRLKPAQLAEAWEAHALTKGVAELTEGTFGAYRTALTKLAGDGGARNATVIGTTGLGKRTAPGSHVTPSPAAKRATAGDATPGAAPGLASGLTPGATPAAAAQTRPRSGLSAVDGLTTPSGRGPGSPSSQAKPGSAATVITPVKSRAAPKFADRPQPGAVVATYNPAGLPPAAARDRVARGRGAAAVALHPAAARRWADAEGPFRHMFAPLEERSAALEERLTGMGEALHRAHGLRTEEEEQEEEMLQHVEGGGGAGAEKGTGRGAWAPVCPVGVPMQSKVVCIGRVCNEAHEGRLNKASIRLEGSRQLSSGARVQLGLEELLVTPPSNSADLKPTVPTSYSLFPGQIVAVEGVCSSGRKIQASRLLEGVPPPADKATRAELLEYHHGSERQNGSPLSIVSLCGPFTTRDNLDYDPLVEALVQIQKDRPDVVILCGPFVDGRQPLIAGGEPTVALEDGSETKVSSEKLFADKVSLLLEEMYTVDPDLTTQVVLVPSLDDAFLDAVYPQPPMEDRAPGVDVPRDQAGMFGDLGLRHVEAAGREDRPARGRPRRVHCVPNPCTLRINDVTVGVTSTDILAHLSADECNAGLPPNTRLARLASHLVRQRSYYPLFPAAKGACLDLSKTERWEMPARPDVLIVPSRLNAFAKEVCDGTTVAVNPGTLARGTTGGTYAVVDVHPVGREALEQSETRVKQEGETGAAAELAEQGVQARVRVDIKRI